MGKGKKWTDAEIAIIKKHYKGNSRETLMALLPERTWVSIRRMASQLKVKSGRFFDKKEIEYFRNNPDVENSVLEKKFGRTRNSIKCKRSRLGIGSAADNCADSISLIELGRMLGKEPKHFEKTFVSNGLKVKPHKRNYLRMVKISESLRFLKEHPELWKAVESESWYFEAISKEFYETVFLPKLREERHSRKIARWGEWLDKVAK